MKELHERVICLVKEYDALNVKHGMKGETWEKVRISCQYVSYYVCINVYKLGAIDGPLNAIL